MNDLTVPILPNGLTPLLRTFLGSQELAKHKATLGVELEVLAKKFDRFGWDRDKGSAAHDRLIADWMNALQDYPLEEVQAACAKAVLDNPNKMPNEGHIREQIEKARAAVVARMPKSAKPEVQREVVSGEAATAIMAEVGIKLKRFGDD